MASKTINNSFSSRVGSATSLSGSEALSVENVQEPSQTISAVTEEQTAFNAIKDHQMQSMLLRSDQDATAQFLGVRYAVVSTTAAAVFPGVLHAGGDLTEILFPGDIIRVEGSVADDGIYMVETVAFGADTTITLTDGHEFPGAGGGAVGTVARVCGVQQLSYHYTVTTVAVTGVITVAGDLSDVFADGDWLAIAASTANDGLFEILTVATDGPPVTTTTITLALGALPSAVNDGDLQLVRPSFVLTANTPFLWTRDSGVLNPFLPSLPNTAAVLNQVFNQNRGDVSYCMVDVPGAVNALFEGIISTDAILLPQPV